MGLKDKIKQNLGASMPAMISRAGNMFTLRDAAGNERPSVHTLDVILIDGNSNPSKVYREDRNFDPDDPTPPDCWSDNGEAPSLMALKPQNDSCAICPKNRRGSATSKVDGKPIKACSDNQKLAVMVVGDNARVIYQLLITPGNLSAFRAYIKTLEGHKYEPEEVITRLTFVRKSMGILQFEPVAEITEDDSLFIQNVAGTPHIKFVTGEDDQPIAALPAPPKQAQIGQSARDPTVTTASEIGTIARTGPASTKENVFEPTAIEKRQPTREELEAQLAAMRQQSKEAEAPKRGPGRPRLVETPQQEVIPPKQDIPAFLRRDPPPNNSSFGMTGNAQPIPDEVSKLVDQHKGNGNVPPLQERMKAAFGLPLRT